MFCELCEGPWLRKILMMILKNQSVFIPHHHSADIFYSFHPLWSCFLSPPRRGEWLSLSLLKQNRDIHFLRRISIWAKFPFYSMCLTVSLKGILSKLFHSRLLTGLILRWDTEITSNTVFVAGYQCVNLANPLKWNLSRQMKAIPCKFFVLHISSAIAHLVLIKWLSSFKSWL